MLIDWFTVLAQTFNFLILVWLLKHFLYRPILDAIAAREQRIAAELADAAAKKAAAQTERDEFKRKNDEFNRQRASLLSATTAEVAAERQRLFDAARKDADNLRNKQQEALRNEYQSLHAEIARRTQAEVFAIARKTLADLAGTNLEAQMTDSFVQRLHGLDVAEKNKLASLLPSPAAPALVRSAFELPPAQRALIASAVEEILATTVAFRFETDPDLISGIELSMQGQKIAWSIADYLAALDKSVSELLKTQLKTATPP